MVWSINQPGILSRVWQANHNVKRRSHWSQFTCARVQVINNQKFRLQGKTEG